MNTLTQPTMQHWPPALYHNQECAVCAAGGFCREAAVELAQSIAADVITAGAVATTDFFKVTGNVLEWMAANDVKGGEVLSLGDSYLAWLAESGCKEIRLNPRFRMVSQTA